MSLEERRKLASVWDVSQANCTRYCLRPYGKKLEPNRWARMLTIMPAAAWRARLDEALVLEEAASQGHLEDSDAVVIDLVVPAGIKMKITLNGSEVNVN